MHLVWNIVQVGDEKKVSIGIVTNPSRMAFALTHQVSHRNTELDFKVGIPVQEHLFSFPEAKSARGTLNQPAPPRIIHSTLHFLMVPWNLQIEGGFLPNLKIIVKEKYL